MSSAPRRVTRANQVVRGPDKPEIDAILADFGQTLKSRRTSAGLTQEALAHRTFLRAVQVSRFERGKAEPHLTVLLTLAYALDTTGSQLLNGMVLAPTRRASSQQMLDVITANAGISTSDLAFALQLPQWYVNQNARRMQSLGVIHWARTGWITGADGSSSPPDAA